MVDTFHCKVRKADVPADEQYCKYICELVMNKYCSKKFKYWDSVLNERDYNE